MPQSFIETRPTAFLKAVGDDGSLCSARALCEDLAQLALQDHVEPLSSLWLDQNIRVAGKTEML